MHVVTGIHPQLDEAAVRLLQNMPVWAAKQVDFKTKASYKELTIVLKNKKALLY